MGHRPHTLALGIIALLPALVTAQPQRQAHRQGLRGALEGEALPTLKSFVQVQQLVRDVRAASYPELDGADIRVHEYASDSVFFRSRFTASSVLGRRRYVIDVSKTVYSRLLPLSAARAIIAHELAHTSWYHTRKKRQWVSLVGVLLCKEREVPFERATDLDAIGRGYGGGIIEYREWLYGVIPASKVANKKRVYLTPSEIELVTRALREDPALLEGWMRDPPRDLAAFRAALGERSPPRTS